MIHHQLLEQIRRERGDEEAGFIFPDYGRHSLSEIVPTVEAMFGLTPDRPRLPQEMWARHDRRRRVVLLLLDGFAYTHFVRYAKDHRFLSLLAEKGDVYPITSVFPSTTPAALTTLHTGLTPQEHGLPEWTVFFEEVGAVIETLPFRVLMTKGRDTLLSEGRGSEMLYAGRTIYQALHQHDVPSHVFTYADYAKSAYSMVTQRGAEVVPYTNLREMVVHLRENLEQPANWGYSMVYWGGVDSVQHMYGPYSAQHSAAVAELCATIEQELLDKLSETAAADTLLLVSADHGHIQVSPEQMVYLDEYVALEKLYSRSQAGPPIPPTGGPQDVFLFIPPQAMGDATEILKRELGDRARVMTMKQAIDKQLFGFGRPSERFLRRVGTLLVLPRRGTHVWYRFHGTEFGQKGAHGGLSADEMFVPFAIAPMSELISKKP